MMKGQPRLTPQQRVRLAQSLRRQANKLGVPVRKKLEKRRHASNLMQINLIEARASRESCTAVKLGERGEIFGEVLAEAACNFLTSNYPQTEPAQTAWLYKPSFSSSLLLTSFFDDLQTMQHINRRC
jgi:hypothetical protein